jgi:hypothetical protein
LCCGVIFSMRVNSWAVKSSIGFLLEDCVSVQSGL